MPKIYVVTTFTGTVLSTAISKVTKVPYAHVSLSFNEDLAPMYSYGRKIAWAPFPGGFVEEERRRGLFRLKPLTRSRIYSLEVTEKQKAAMEHHVAFVAKHRRYFKYDTMALFRLYFHRNRKRPRFVCSTFVAKALERAGLDLFKKDASLVTPLDFYRCPHLELEFEGLLDDYVPARPMPS